MKKNKILIGVLSTSLLLSGLAVTSPVSAESIASNEKLIENSNNEVSDFKMINQTDKTLKYTYTQNGENFMVEEEFLSESEVTSTVFIKNKETGEYEKDDIITTSYLKDEEVVVQNSESLGEIDRIHINPKVDYNAPTAPTINHSELLSQTGKSAKSISPLASSESWKYYSTSNGTSTPTRWLVGAIGITISAITKVPATAKWVVNIANLTYQLGSKAVYYKYVYYKRGSGISTETLTHRYIYTDSGRTKAVGRSTTLSGRTGMKVISTQTY